MHTIKNLAATGFKPLPQPAKYSDTSPLCHQGADHLGKCEVLPETSSALLFGAPVQ